MPTYTYKSKDTGEVFDLSMSIAEMEQYEKDNPEHERVYNKMNVVDPVGIGVTRPPADFSKYVLGKVKAANPHTVIGQRRWDIKKEV